MHKSESLGFKPQGSAGTSTHTAPEGVWHIYFRKKQYKSTAQAGSVPRGARYRLSTTCLHFGVQMPKQGDFDSICELCSRKGAGVAHGTSDVTQTSSSSQEGQRAVDKPKSPPDDRQRSVACRNTLLKDTTRCQRHRVISPSLAHVFSVSAVGLVFLLPLRGLGGLFHVGWSFCARFLSWSVGLCGGRRVRFFLRVVSRGFSSFWRFSGFPVLFVRSVPGRSCGLNSFGPQWTRLAQSRISGAKCTRQSDGLNFF